MLRYIADGLTDWMLNDVCRTQFAIIRHGVTTVFVTP